jgi:hypothetical protein
MLRNLSSSRSALARRVISSTHVACLATEAQPNRLQKKEGDISSVFPSLSGAAAVSLPPRFSDLKKELLPTSETRERLAASWTDLLIVLREGVSELQSRGNEVIPEVSFAELESGSTAWQDEVRKRGSVVIRDVVEDADALRWKKQVLEYVKENPEVKGK